MKPICGNDTYLVMRNDRTKITMVENKKNRTICPIDDRDWQPFVEMILTANKHVIRAMEEEKNVQ